MATSSPTHLLILLGRESGSAVADFLPVIRRSLYNWKKQLLDGAASVFEGGTSAEGAANEARVDLLYRQIGQLKVENDFLARKLGK